MTLDTRAYQLRLTEEKERLIAELKTLGIENTNAAGDWIPTPEDVERFEADPNIVADQSENWAERRGSLDVLETRLRNVKRALKKIEDGAYGICEISGEPVEEDRLNANPAARTCKVHIEDEAALNN